MNLDENLQIREPAHRRVGQLEVQRGGDRLGQGPVAVAGKDFHTAEAPELQRIVGGRVLATRTQTVTKHYLASLTGRVPLAFCTTSRTPPPTIAAINGVAAGAGLSVALAADLRVASDQARFTTAFAKVGFSGDFGGTWLLQRLVGPAKAKELYFMSEIFPAQRALELGLVTKVVPHDSLMDETMALARRLAEGPTLAYGRMKDNFSYGATNSFGDALTREAENMIASGQTEDHKAAALAFVEKREPRFAGR